MPPIHSYKVGIVTFDSATGGALKRTKFQPLAALPADDPSVFGLLSPSFLGKRFHRLYFQIVFNRQSGESGAVLLAADSNAGLTSLGARLIADPAAARGEYCVFAPANATVSLEFEIMVNRAPMRVHFGASVKTVVGTHDTFTMQRQLKGRRLPVEIDTKDPDALRLPVWPGDRFSW